MKKFRAQLIRSNSGPPRPFPGMFPTRWNIRISYRDNPSGKGKLKKWEYLGKPNQVVASFVSLMIAKKFGRIDAMEFDRGGMVNFGGMHLPGVGSLASQQRVSRLYGFYYPCSAARGILITNWAGGDGKYRLRLKIGEKKFVVYSNARVCSQQKREELESWLSTQKFM